MAAKKSSMNPKLIGIIAVVVVLLGVGAYFMMGKKNAPGTSNGSNAFTSIKDALTKSVSLECDYQEADMSYKVFVKNGAVRMDNTSSDPEKNGSIIMKDKKMYMWNGKEGFVMTIPDVKDAEGNTVEDSTQSEEILKDLEEYKDHCKASVVSDSLFTPPAEVTFSDMSQMNSYNEADVQKMMEQYGNNENMETDSVMHESEY